jgi:hypothetical protein
MESERDPLAGELTALRDTLNREVKGLSAQVTRLREEVTKWEATLNKMRKDHIKEILTRDQLERHDIYAFPQLVYHRILHHYSNPMTRQDDEGEAPFSPLEGLQKSALTSEEDEFFIYGSRLSFIRNPVRNDIKLKGLAYGLQHGMQFRLSILSPLSDPRDTERVHRDRQAARDTLDYLKELRSEAESWPGKLLVSATPMPVEDSFSSVRIACDRRVSVLAGTRYKEAYEWVFDQWPDNSERCLARDLLDTYRDRYEEETFPIFMINWTDPSPADLIVRLVVFVGARNIVEGRGSTHAWVAWEFPWDEADQPSAIVTHRLKHRIGAPPLLENTQLVDIVYAGRTREGSKSFLTFFARAYNPRPDWRLSDIGDVKTHWPEALKSAADRYGESG